MNIDMLRFGFAGGCRGAGRVYYGLVSRLNNSVELHSFAYPALIAAARSADDAIAARSVIQGCLSPVYMG